MVEHASHNLSRNHNRRAASKHAIRLVLLITLGFFVVEVLGGYFTHSLALLADAGHLLTDVGALALALFAFWMAERPASLERTYGHLRFEILAALLNGVALLVLAGFIAFEAFRRLAEPPEVLSLPMLVIAVVGLGGNLIGVVVLHRSSGESMNVRAALAHVVADALSSVAVIVAGILMLTLEWYLADPVTSMVASVLIVVSGMRVTWSSIHVLMEGTPSDVKPAEVRRAMEAVQGVREVHDFHIWTITSGFYALSAHVVLDKGLAMEQAELVLAALHKVASCDHGIEHVTIQLESRPPEWPRGEHFSP